MEDKQRFLKCLKIHKGIISHAAEHANISRATHYNWMKTDAAYKEEVDAINEDTIDYVESKLMQLIDGPSREVVTEFGIQTIKDAPNTAATIFYLKTKGKHRGYVERQEITGADGNPFQIVIPKEV